MECSILQVIKALQTQHRTETQWGLLVDRIMMLEDVAQNQVSHDHRYRPTFELPRPFWLRILYGPTVGNAIVCGCMQKIIHIFLYFY
jgi:hypothetical protein